MIIAFEGGEGSGKNIQIDLLLEYLEANKYKTLSVREPGGTPTSEAIRDILLNRKDLDVDIITEIFLFSASRAQLVREVINPQLKEVDVVITNRSFYTTLAYTGYGFGIDRQIIWDLTEIAVENTKPDYIILLDIPPEIGVSRKRNQNEINKIDLRTLDFHKRARAGYLELAKNELEKWFVIDGSKSIEEVHNEIKNIIISIL